MALEMNTCNTMVDGDPTTAKLMIVGMAPGREELEQNRPFVGGTGQILFSILKQHGIDRADCYMLNVIGEWPEKKTGPSAEQLAAYHDRFNELALSFKGQAVLVLGGDALSRYTGLSGGIESWRGYVVKPTDVCLVKKVYYETGTYKSGPKKGQPKKIKHTGVDKAPVSETVKYIFPTLHPAAVMRTGFGTLPALAADIGRAARYENLRLEPDAYYSIPTGSQITSPPNIEYAAFDIETAGIGGGLDRIGICWRGDLPWSASWSASTRLNTKHVLERPDVLKIAHNIAFDYPRLVAAGVNLVGPFADTMLMAAMLQPDMPKGLKYVSPMYLDTHRWDDKADEQPAFYNAMDAHRTRRLYEVLDEELKKTGQHDLFHAIIMPGMMELMRMSKIGLHTDPIRRAAWITKIKAELSVAWDKWKAKYPEVNPKSPTQLKTLLYDQLGMQVQFDKYGTVTTNELALRNLLFEYPEHKEIIDLLLEIRGLEKDLNTYADVAVGLDNCVHPSYLPAGKDDDRYDPEDGSVLGKGLAGTWRPTAKHPNIQNQTGEARKLYTPRKPGYYFAEADYKAFEAEILAALSGDTILKEAIKNGLHKANMALLGVDKTRAKNAFYGWSYGAGAKTLQQTFKAKGFDVDFGTCKQMLKKFDERYAKAARWRDEQIALAKVQRYVENPFGLRRYFYSASPGPAAANSPIQSTAAIIMWKILPELGAAVRTCGGELVAMVHDSVEFELPEGFDLNSIRNIMTQPFHCVEENFSVPVDIKIGPSWGEVQECPVA